MPPAGLRQLGRRRLRLIAGNLDAQKPLDPALGPIEEKVTAGQRLWVSFCIFFTVIAWLYAIGRILSLMQDPAFTRATTEARFIMAVRNISQPFTIVCGYGEAGNLLVRAMAQALAVAEAAAR